MAGIEDARLIEREDALQELHRAWGRVRAGRGEIALVTAEAGGGKSMLLAALMARLAGAPLVLRGGCDPLAAPRPLGPLIDAVAAVDPQRAAELAAGATRAEAFATAQRLLDGSAGTPTVLVIEDVHWADEATLDLVTFLGRRIAELGSWLVLSYRDDEVDGRHPLRARLVELAAVTRCRVQLRPLSAEGVAELIEVTGLDPVELHAMTGGNPFYVTEVVAAGAPTLPPSVRDAVAARAGRLDSEGRAVLDAASIVPGRAERWLLTAIAGGDDAAVGRGLDTCIERGLLVPVAPGVVAFRHELARVAILDELPVAERRERHRRALAALRSTTGTDVVRLAHHAVEADDGAAVVELAPAAARAAAAAGAHRAAAVQLGAVLAYTDRLSASEQATVLFDLGRELMLVGSGAEAVVSFDRSAELAALAGDLDREVAARLEACSALSSLGRRAESLARLHAADALVGGRPAGRSTALVELSWCVDLMLARQLAAADERGRTAIAMATSLGEDDIVAEALIQSGIAVAMNGDDAGLERIVEGSARAARLGLDDVAALGDLQIGSGMGEQRRYDLAVPALQRSRAIGHERELLVTELYSTAWLARCGLEQGQWDEAATLAVGVVHHPRSAGIARIVALVTLGWVRTRRGDPEAAELLDEALELARATAHLQRLWPVAACRAEAAWMAGDMDGERDLLDEVAALAAEFAYAPAVEELDHWRAIADGHGRGDATQAQTPFGLTAAGAPEHAASAWERVGCPYEHAVALLLADRPDELRLAHGIADDLGATPLRARIAAQLRAHGAAVPRRPTATTQANPLGLTERQLDILGQLATGASNRQIATALGISAKTVDHHVSAVLAKLGARTRAEAAAEAVRRGLAPTR